RQDGEPVRCHPPGKPPRIVYHLVMVSPLKTWRRKRLLARHTIDESLWREVVSRLPTLQRLTAEDIERLRKLALLFLHEKRLEPAGGIELDDTKRVTIAALACLPILELGLDC